MKGNKPQEFQLLNWNADGTLKINKIAATSLVDLDTLPDKIRKALLIDRLAKGVREAPEEKPLQVRASSASSTEGWKEEPAHSRTCLERG